MTEQTTIRIDIDTLNALRIARGEIIAATRQHIGSDDAAVEALVRYWDTNKRDTHAVTTPPALTPQEEL